MQFVTCGKASAAAQERLREMVPECFESAAASSPEKAPRGASKGMDVLWPELLPPPFSEKEVTAFSQAWSMRLAPWLREKEVLPAHWLAGCEETGASVGAGGQPGEPLLSLDDFCSDSGVK